MKNLATKLHLMVVRMSRNSGAILVCDNWGSRPFKGPLLGAAITLFSSEVQEVQKLLNKYQADMLKTAAHLIDKY